MYKSRIALAAEASWLPTAEHCSCWMQSNQQTREPKLNDELVTVNDHFIAIRFEDGDDQGDVNKSVCDDNAGS